MSALDGKYRAGVGQGLLARIMNRANRGKEQRRKTGAKNARGHRASTYKKKGKGLNQRTCTNTKAQVENLSLSLPLSLPLAHPSIFCPPIAMGETTMPFDYCTKT